MNVHMSESEIYRGAWATDEMRELFDDESRTREWCRLIGVLARAQAAVGIIPENAAREISEVCRNPDFDLSEVRSGYERTGHSMLGLIELLEEQCEDGAGEWVYYGATVQDITDTWFMLTLNRVHEIVLRDGQDILETCLDLAERYRDTPMVGRTHGQAGSPITFGFKAAVWADEFGRHLQRLREVKPRIGVGQLAGAVGGLTAYGEEGEELRGEFFDRLSLSPPDIAWINARDRIVEFFQVLSLMVSSLEKIGQEVYNLQRSEINELQEGLTGEVVGSITMPHKRNPEISEQLGTLARLVRSHTDELTGALVHDHERDGRAWKLEWESVPAACLAAGASLNLSRSLLENLEVNVDSMAENIQDRGGQIHSERLMLKLASRVGKQSAHRHVHELARQTESGPGTFEQRVRRDDWIQDQLGTEELDEIFRGTGGLQSVYRSVDRVLEDHGRS